MAVVGILNVNILKRWNNMTLKEFLKVNWHEHFRIYQPNRDCLIYESYREVHSPYFFDEEHEKNREYINNQFWISNGYCDDVYQYPEVIDRETKQFLERFGDYEVFSIEIGSFRPESMYTDDEDKLHIESVMDGRYPNQEYLECYNIFIK